MRVGDIYKCYPYPSSEDKGEPYFTLVGTVNQNGGWCECCGDVAGELVGNIFDDPDLLSSYTEKELEQ